MIRPAFARTVLAILALSVLSLAAAEAGFTIDQPAADGIYAVNDTVTWTVSAHDIDAAQLSAVSYRVQRNGTDELAKGTIDLSAGSATFSASAAEPCTMLVTVSVDQPNGGKPVKATTGSAIAPRSIPPSMPVPDDFDAFWDGKLAEQNAIPMNPVLSAEEPVRDGVESWKITMDTVGGAHLHGRLARKKEGSTFPALLIVQWAGVYPLDPNWALNPASQGWLVLNTIAHDQPIEQPKSFYDDLGKTILKNYTAIGGDDRETSYFLRMCLAASRAADYLASRDDWDGRTLVVTGGSQGGYQSLVAAGLNPKITALMASVPAGCDHTAAEAGRAIGWPYWMNNFKGNAKALEACRYFDGVNFARRVTCPALVGMGLSDTTSRPTGVFAAVNQLKGPVEVVVMPTSGHQGKHAEYAARFGAWSAALLAGKGAPISAPGEVAP